MPEDRTKHSRATSKSTSPAFQQASREVAVQAPRPEETPEREPPEGEPPRREPPADEPPRHDPGPNEPGRREPPVEDPPRQDPPRQDPPPERAATRERNTVGAVLRHDWTRDEIRAIYHQPLTDLLFSAQQVHREFHDPRRVQFCRLLSIKTGGCPEDCAYCPQSAHYSTNVERGGLLPIDEVAAFAERARKEGATRFCMGAAWRSVQDGPDFDGVLEMVRRVAKLGMEVCCSLGMLDDSQAERLAAAGLTAYNHNLDTSPEFYGQIITTRTYEDRLRTLAAVRKAGVTVCCGGIVGMGESDDDRIGLLQQLASQTPHPESVPINALVRVAGTPLESNASIDPMVMVRTMATARILMPAAMVRLSAGRRALSREAVALCFMAGANSLFIGEKLLTTPNPDPEDDAAMLHSLGLEPLPLR